MKLARIGPTVRAAYQVARRHDRQAADEVRRDYHAGRLTPHQALERYRRLSAAAELEADQ